MNKPPVPLALSQPVFNPVMLPQGLQRGMIAASAPRSDKFIASYERNVLFYDVFWEHGGKRIILIGPPAIDLAPHYRAARYVAQPSGVAVKAKAHHSSTVFVFSLRPPAGTTHLDIELGGATQRVGVAQNHSDFFAGRNLLFTLSQNNDLQWIADWARFHVVNQGVDAVLLFDNRSTRYTPADIEATLLAVPGLQRVAVVPTPFTYPHEDRGVPKHIFWAHFLQPAVIVDMFRRYGMASNGILNCDIDELAVPLADKTVFAEATASRSGTVYFRGCWIEPVPEKDREGGYRHADFRQVEADVNYGRGGTNKWALTPNRPWLQKLRIHPYPHSVANRPPLSRHKPGTAYIAHFKAISTGWKYDRGVVDAAAAPIREDAPLSAALDRAFGSDRG